MTPLRQRMLEDMQLRGLSPKTQRCYIQAVQQLAQYYAKSPALISEDELRETRLPQHSHHRLVRHQVPL